MEYFESFQPELGLVLLYSYAPVVRPLLVPVVALAVLIAFVSVAVAVKSVVADGTAVVRANVT